MRSRANSMYISTMCDLSAEKCVRENRPARLSHRIAIRGNHCARVVFECVCVYVFIAHAGLFALFFC